ncbi:MAG: IS1595 family transposase [Polyangiales bacterium]
MRRGSRGGRRGVWQRGCAGVRRGRSMWVRQRRCAGVRRGRSMWGLAAPMRRGSVVRTDGCNGYDYLQAFGYKHQCKVLHGDAAATKEWLPMVHIVISNLKTWLRGTHHGVSPQHLQTYLNEYVFRFNRRFYPMTSFASVLGIGSVSRGPTYEGLYGGDWEHKRNDAEAAQGVPTGRQRPAKRRRWANRR